MTEHKNTPELRFPEFKEEWKFQKLGNLAQFSKGKSLSKKDLNINGNPCILYGELYTKYGAILNKVYSKTSTQNDSLVFSKRNQILIPSSGETDIDIATATAIDTDVKIAIGGDLNIITPINSDGRFISLYINGKGKYNLAKYAQGKSVVHLYNSDIKKLNFYLPTNMVEQKKIGNFFSKLDQQIELEEKKLELLEQQKRGYMQKIFTQQLRFKSENGNDYPEWKKEIIGNIATTFSGGTPSSNNSTFYTGEIPFIRSGEISKTSTELMINEKAISNSSAKMVETGDLLYALYGATSGEVAISKINGAINQAVLCIRSQESIGYIFNYLKMKKDQILKTYIQGGQGNLSASIIKKVDIDLPSLEEQEKIGTFFNKIDNLIELQANKVDLLKQRKKGLLQKMFI
ncbi:restriction endonuclease subunit S [Staphylococcus borealis]|uniref:restriction endonuclease subunit S n=1 Tax=Staphylococcus borealis TaxID=2742203 RepID=UPI002DBFB0C9|nr:restriction endonuclease subunit S [Staphylococcus borealis]MEB6610473.1 restriction endonuclease subunit S [Staphylococcus borealis]